MPQYLMVLWLTHLHLGAVNAMGEMGGGGHWTVHSFPLTAKDVIQGFWMLSRFTVLTSFVIICGAASSFPDSNGLCEWQGTGGPALQRGLSATLIIEDSNCSNEAAARKINVENDCWKLPCERKTWSLIVCLAFNYFEPWFSVVQLRICREGLVNNSPSTASLMIPL